MAQTGVVTRWAIAWPLLMMAGITFLSSIPGAGPSAPGAFLIVPPALQNLLHLPLYGMLAWLWVRALPPYGVYGWVALAVAALLSMGWGLFDEVYQMHVPGRFASLTDVMLNATGVAVSLLAYRLVQKRDKR